MSLKIALAQLNFTVGGIAENTHKIISSALRARDLDKADLIVYPELALTGYPPEDLLFRDDFMTATDEALIKIAKATIGIAIILGYPRRDNGLLYNSAAYLSDGKLLSFYDKCALPNYGVFDEQRYFASGQKSSVISLKEIQLGITICEDVWQTNCIQEAVSMGAETIVSINASPFHIGKQQERLEVIRQRVQENAVPIIYLNHIGGQDELVFDGASFAVNAKGQCVHQAVAFEESISFIEIQGKKLVSLNGGDNVLPTALASVYQALVLAIREYVTKNGFKGVVIGLSGGVDSALTLTLAVAALGADNVEAVMLPSKYTSSMSFEDSRTLASKLAVDYKEVSIQDIVDSVQIALKPVFADKTADATEENIQTRSRGVVLMAIANKYNKLVLTTGNKSEMAVGYATLYGDMVGGFAPLKDVSKTLVYQLCYYINQQQSIIPERIITRAPSAELAPDQKDEDSLPPYSILDAILERYIEQQLSVDQIVTEGFDRDTVQDVIRRVNINEYKRRQSAPGVKITPLAFGRERRYPITSAYDRNWLETPEK